MVEYEIYDDIVESNEDPPIINGAMDPNIGFW